jgi:hypothetical protein
LLTIDFASFQCRGPSIMHHIRPLSGVYLIFGHRNRQQIGYRLLTIWW